MSAEPPKPQGKEKKASVFANISIERSIEVGVLKLLFAYIVWINCWSFVAFRYEIQFQYFFMIFFLSLPLKESHNNNERISKCVC